MALKTQVRLFLYFFRVLSLYNCHILQAMVRMKALQARCVAKEGVVRHQYICLKHGADWLSQYKEAARILNIKVNEKKVKLEATTCWCEELVKSNTNLMTELTTLREQMEQLRLTLWWSIRSLNLLKMIWMACIAMASRIALSKLPLFTLTWTCPK